VNVAELVFGERPEELAPRNMSRFNLKRAYATAMHPIYFGMILAVLSPWLVCLLDKRESAATRGFVMFVVPIMLLGLMATISKTPIMTVLGSWVFLLGATIDTTASIGHGPSIVAFQNAGESTSTLGEVRHRSDLVIYWACDPLTSHPRHMERFVEAAGFSIPNGRKDRHVVVVDSEATATSAKADTFLRIQKGSDFEVLWTLRALLKGIDIYESTVGGVDVDSLRQLVQRMKASHYGAVFFGVTLTESLTGNTNVEALLRLVTDLNMFTRFVARRMRVPGDVTGADSVLCWQTGYPFSVNLSRGFPRFNPVEYSAGPMLERGETDCVILVGAERVDRFSEAARSNLRRIPVILLDPPNANWNVRADVRFNTAIYGIHRRATAYRMDEVPVPLRQILNSSLPSDDEVLRAILKRL
jgi:formylmethanofuran dehydrogenase subunit B